MNNFPGKSNGRASGLLPKLLLSSLIVIACVGLSRSAYGQRADEPPAAECSTQGATPGETVLLGIGCPAPYTGELVLSNEFAAILADGAHLERELTATKAANTKKLQLAEERRIDEVEQLQAEVDRQHELALKLATASPPGAPFWEAPTFMFSAGVLVGALVAIASYKLGAEAFP